MSTISLIKFLLPKLGTNHTNWFTFLCCCPIWESSSEPLEQDNKTYIMVSCTYARIPVQHYLSYVEDEKLTAKWMDKYLVLLTLINIYRAALPWIPCHVCELIFLYRFHYSFQWKLHHNRRRIKLIKHSYLRYPVKSVNDNNLQS